MLDLVHIIQLPKWMFTLDQINYNCLDYVMYVVRNQMQTGIRQNRKRLFKQKVESQVVRFAQHKITRQKSLALSLVLALVVTSHQICRQKRQGLGRIRNRTKGCRVQYLNRLAYKNRRRIKINVLTGWHTNYWGYLYTWDKLQGFWVVRMD